jgi:hypothetical protein
MYIGCVASVSDVVATWICSGDPIKIVLAATFFLGMAVCSVLYVAKAFSRK